MSSETDASRSSASTAHAAHDVERDADVVILGASFAGIEVLYQLLRRSGGRALRIIVVDRQERHGYLPLVHERLLDTLPSSELSTAQFCRGNPGVRFVQGEVVALEPATKTVHLGDGTALRGHVLVVALGSLVVPPASLPGAEYLHPYKFQGEFEALSRKLSQLRERDEAARVVVVGGGISGVELAAELATHSHRGRKLEVTLIGGRRPLLASQTQRVRKRVVRALEELGVELRWPAQLLAAHHDGVTIEEQIDGGPKQSVYVQCDLAVWAGGLQAPPILGRLGLPCTADGWLAVGPTLQCFPGTEGPERDIFACGDAVRVIGGNGEWPTMQRAIECLWQAKVVARNVVTVLERGKASTPSLTPHVLRRTFFYGISLGPRSLVVYRHVVVELSRINRWFRRWLMRQYFARYAPVTGAAPREH